MSERVFNTAEIVPEFVIKRAEAILGHKVADRLRIDSNKFLDGQAEYGIVSSFRILTYPSGYESFEIGFGLIYQGKIRALDARFADVMPSLRQVFGSSGDVYFEVYVPAED